MITEDNDESHGLLLSTQCSTGETVLNNLQVSQYTVLLSIINSTAQYAAALALQRFLEFKKDW